MQFKHRIWNKSFTENFLYLQQEMSKKREYEVNKLRKDLELANAQFESSEHSLRKRHTETVNDLSEQLEYVNKSKNRYVKHVNCCC